MVAPGEINQAIGHAYQYVLTGALEATVPPFSVQFHVHDAPAKTSFVGRDGRSFSFDFVGLYRHPWHAREVFGECKGYSLGSNLLAEYRRFLAKAYVVCCDNKRHESDFFWFITNVPFGCSEGPALLRREFIETTLRNESDPEIKRIIGAGHIDRERSSSLADRVGVFIFTDSFLKSTDILYKVAPGETLWTILKKLHAGKAPENFGETAALIARRNGLSSPDHILSDSKLRVSWQGLSP